MDTFVYYYRLVCSHRMETVAAHGSKVIQYHLRKEHEVHSL